MSRQEIRFYGKQEFGQYPLITMEPRPETLSDYYKIAVRGDTGVRKKNINKHLVCGKTAKTYLFWDNLVYHYKNLAPLYGKKIEFKEYKCPHDGWLYNFPENLKLHNKISHFELAEASEIEHRLNVDNSDWEHPSERKMERYTVNTGDTAPKPGVKKSRFLKIEPPMPSKPKKVDDEEEEMLETRRKKIAEKENKGLERHFYEPTHKYDYPHDPEMLAPLPRPKTKKVPEYYGWTHSEDADSWFLEAHTPSKHQYYEDFYTQALEKRVICPKLYSTAC